MSPCASPKRPPSQSFLSSYLRITHHETKRVRDNLSYQMGLLEGYVMDSKLRLSLSYKSNHVDDIESAVSSRSVDVNQPNTIERTLLDTAATDTRKNLYGPSSRSNVNTFGVDGLWNLSRVGGLPRAVFRRLRLYRSRAPPSGRWTSIALW